SMSKKSSSKKQLLGKILMDRNIINQSQLKHALEVQEEQGNYFGEILTGLGYVDEHDVVAALVVQCHIPYIAIDKYEIDQSIVRLVPGEVARKYHMIPLDRVNNILSVVMADPLDEAAKAELKRLTKCRLAPFIATDSEIDKAISRWYDSDPQ
ncbi:MAG: type II secretion system protein GspE, partial [Candidatus Omnitrophica bacterium]|nr:type II secretion system protein GspE [Candidatus Omnitrophota bacterium]